MSCKFSFLLSRLLLVLSLRRDWVKSVTFAMYRMMNPWTSLSYEAHSRRRLLDSVVQPSFPQHGFEEVSSFAVLQRRDSSLVLGIIRFFNEISLPCSSRGRNRISRTELEVPSRNSCFRSLNALSSGRKTLTEMDDSLSS